MQAIDGDGSLRSYFEASILARELAEFGAIWHGISWGEHIGPRRRSLHTRQEKSIQTLSSGRFETLEMGEDETRRLATKSVA